MDELQSKKYLETNWKVGAYQILWKGHDCSNMEFWKHVQFPQQRDGCSFPHRGNLDLSVRYGDRAVKCGGKTWAGPWLCHRSAAWVLACHSVSLCPCTCKGGHASCAFKFSDLLRGANFLIALSFSATLYNLCCKKNSIYWRQTLSMHLAAFLSRLLLDGEEPRWDFVSGTFWHWVVGGFSRLLCSVTQQWGWWVASRGDCRLDRAVSLFLSKAGVYFRCW